MTFSPLEKPERIRRVGALAIALITVGVTAASAVPGPKWDRRVKAVEIKPPGLGDRPARGGALPYEVSVQWWIVCDDEILVPRDLSTDIELQINGLPFASTSTTAYIDPGSGLCTDATTCGGGCGTGGSEGLGASLVCVSDGPGDCKCALPDIVWRLPEPPYLQPGDQITAILAPAPGAEPETEPGGDVLTFTLQDAEGIFWNRKINSVLPVSVGPDIYDLEADGALWLRGVEPFVNWNGQVPLSFDIVVEINGSEVTRSPVEFDPFPIGSTDCVCFDACGVYPPALETLYCIPGQNPKGGCYCGIASVLTVPAVTIQPGDAVNIRLEAGLFALQDNPSWGDDEFLFSCCPFSTDIEAQATPGRETALAQNRPNPFRRSTTISYRIPAPTEVSLEIFDVRGRRVRTLLDGQHREAGDWSVSWDSRDDAGRIAPAGTYFYRLRANGATQSRKMTVLDLPGTN